MKNYDDIWACPYCLRALRKDFSCRSCDFSGYVNNNLIYLHRTNGDWKECLREKQGWINLTKELGLYRENDDHFYLPNGRPHLIEVFGESSRHIDRFLSLENLSGKICLDLGAWIGWVECYTLRKYSDAKLIALEVNDDVLVGLGRSNVLKQYHRCDFYSLVADMHHIPIANNTIDIVFSVDALHHFRALGNIFKEIERVLKPKGRFYGLNEPDRPDGINEDLYVKDNVRSLELKYGVIEKRPTVREYLKSGKTLNLQMFNEQVGLRKNIDTSGLFLRGEKVRRFPFF
jgi:SAM-dependent methyltransferase